MTRNNLDNHLSWLLNRGLSLISPQEKKWLLESACDEQNNGGWRDAVLVPIQQTHTPPLSTIAQQTTSVHSIFARSREGIQSPTAAASTSGTTNFGMGRAEPEPPSTLSLSKGPNLNSLNLVSTNMRNCTSTKEKDSVLIRDQGVGGSNQDISSELGTHRASQDVLDNTNNTTVGIAAIDLTGDSYEEFSSPGLRPSLWFTADEPPPRHLSLQSGRKRSCTELIDDVRPAKSRNCLHSTSKSTSNEPVSTRSLPRRVEDLAQDSEADEFLGDLTPSEIFSDPPVAVNVSIPSENTLQSPANPHHAQHVLDCPDYEDEIPAESKAPIPAIQRPLLARHSVRIDNASKDVAVIP
ncbi:hypothetical protein KEM54_001598, partial [Ascosphaera aggregata]